MDREKVYIKKRFLCEIKNVIKGFLCEGSPSRYTLKRFVSKDKDMELSMSGAESIDLISDSCNNGLPQRAGAGAYCFNF
jgi:hypothetical protein